MRKPDLFDEIIHYLRESAVRSDTEPVSPEILNELFSDLATKRKTPETIPLYDGHSQIQPQPLNGNAVPAHEAIPAAHQEPPVRRRPAAVAQNDPPPAVASAAAAPPQPVGTDASVDLSNASWEELETLLSSCRKCPLCETRNNLVFGDGNRNADLMFIGEGPGADEDEQGLPFVGRAGELLTRIIAAMQFDRKTEVYIANIVKCRPPGNRNPEEAEALCCIDYLKRQIALVRPKVIVLLGAVPMFYLLNKKGITKLHGQWFDYQGVKVMPTYHPAYLLRDASKKADVWRDMQIVMKEFGKTPEKKK